MKPTEEELHKMYEAIKKFILNKLVYSGKNHENVGRIFRSEYLGSYILVTRYFEDNDWYFVRINIEDDVQYGNEMKAGSTLSFFVENDMEVK